MFEEKEGKKRDRIESEAELKIIGSKRDRKSLYGKPAIRMEYPDGKLGQRKLENVEGVLPVFEQWQPIIIFPTSKRCHIIFARYSARKLKLQISNASSFEFLW